MSRGAGGWGAVVWELDSAAVLVPTPALCRQDGAPVGLLVLAGAPHVLTFLVFLSFFIAYKAGGVKKKA